MLTNLLFVYLVLVSILTLADQKLSVWQRGVIKMLSASLFLYLPSISMSNLGTFEWWIFVGLIASWLGDLYLVWSGTGARFKLGILSFLFAHIAYGAAFLFIETNLVLATCLMVIFVTVGVSVYLKLRSHMGSDLRLPVQIYIFALCAMTALAWSVEPPYSQLAFGIAATAFLISDISVALQRFGQHSSRHRLWGIPLYFGAQMGFATLITKGIT